MGKRKSMKARIPDTLREAVPQEPEPVGKAPENPDEIRDIEGTDCRCPRCRSIRTERLSGLLKCHGALYHYRRCKVCATKYRVRYS